MSRPYQCLDVEVAVIPSRRGRRPDVALSGVGEPEPAVIPRTARLMALAIKFDDMIQRGEVRDFAELARLGYVTRARLTQIMNLLLLAPGIQEQLIFPALRIIPERSVRSVASLVSWQDQRIAIADLISGKAD